METRFKTNDGITIHCHEGDFFVRVSEYEYLLKMYEKLKEGHSPEFLLKAFLELEEDDF